MHLVRNASVAKQCQRHDSHLIVYTDAHVTQNPEIISVSYIEFLLFEVPYIEICFQSIKVVWNIVLLYFFSIESTALKEIFIKYINFKY